MIEVYSRIDYVIQQINNYLKNGDITLYVIVIKCGEFSVVLGEGHNDYLYIELLNDDIVHIINNEETVDIKIPIYLIEVFKHRNYENIEIVLLGDLQ